MTLTRQQAQHVDRVISRLARDSGYGMQLTGDRLTSETAAFGTDSATLPNFLAEFRAPAGHVKRLVYDDLMTAHLDQAVTKIGACHRPHCWLAETPGPSRSRKLSSGAGIARMSEPGSGRRLPPTQADVRDLAVGVLGGTGEQGQGLAYRFASAGLEVLIGSRDVGRAAVAAEEIDSAVRGVSNAERAGGGDVVVAVPWEGHALLLESLRDVVVGKVVVDCVNSLDFDSQGAYALPVAESSAQQAVALLPESWVVGAFHHLSAKVLADVEATVSTPRCSFWVMTARRLSASASGAHAGYAGVYGCRVRDATRSRLLQRILSR